MHYGGDMAASWEITPQKVQAAIQKIIETSNPAKLILFGSYISGKTHINSDLDVLVVTKNEIESPRKESVRIRRALKGIGMSMDILVAQADRIEELANTPGSIYREALRHGKVVYESAG